MVLLAEMSGTTRFAGASSSGRVAPGLTNSFRFSLLMRARLPRTASTAGQYGYPLRAPYAAAKWGIVGLMKTLAMELGPHGIRVNVISPGSVQGDRMNGVIEKEAAARGLPVEDAYKAEMPGSDAELKIIYTRNCLFCDLMSL